MNNSDEIFAALDQEMKKQTQAHRSEHADLFAMIHYHLGWKDTRGNPAHADPGKRIRPLLCLWSCQAVGGDWRTALAPAAALELIHNFSLIHDDIQDNSESRRGRATVWSVWGVAQGINTGDALFVLAQQAMDDVPAHLSLERYLAIRRAFDSAILELTGGQYLDLAFERADQVTIAQYLNMVGGKTAALLAAACEIGARLGATEERYHHALATYGEQLGIAFQIADDVLGIWGDPEITGKSVYTDLLSRKKSYPVLYAMQTESGKELRALYAESEWSDDDLRRVQEILAATDARTFAITEAEVYARRAEEALAATGLENDAVARLRELVSQTVHRAK